MQNNKFLIRPPLESKHLHILIFFISSVLRVIIPKLIETNNFAKLDNLQYDYFQEECYFNILANFIGDISAGLFILIKFCKGKDKNEITTSEGEKTKKRFQKRFFIYLPLIAFIDFFAQLCLFSYSFIVSGKKKIGVKILDQDLFFVVTIDILFRYLFSRIFLKSSFYPHHKVSMVLNIIGFFVFGYINLNDIIYRDEYKSGSKFYEIYVYLVLFLIMTILYSLEDVFNKIALNKSLLRPYELMFYKAVFQIIGIIGVSIFMRGDIIEYVKIIISEKLLIGRIFYRLVFIICNIFRTISLITIIEVLNPNHLSILKSTEFIGLFVFIMIWNRLLETQSITINIVESFTCLLILIGSIIHNEMIIINKWGLLECTDYYKIEVKGFSNLNENVEEDKSNEKDKEDSLLGESFD